MFSFNKGKSSKDSYHNGNNNPKHEKPKILLMDLPSNFLDTLKSDGFNAYQGTFGSPYKVESSEGYQPVIGEPILKKLNDQHIIFIDLTSPKVLDEAEGKKSTHESQNDLWEQCFNGSIDPRPRFMHSTKKNFDKIIEHGGVCVIFAQPRETANYVFGRKVGSYLKVKDEIKFMDNWSFLSIFNNKNVQIEPFFSEEITLLDSDNELINFLKKNSNKTQITTTIKPNFANNQWIPFICNRYKDSVGGIIKPSQGKGRIIILPQFSNKLEIILFFLNHALPKLSSHLFPHIEGDKWVERDEYEHESILKLKKEKLTLIKNTKTRINEIENEINDEREKFLFLHKILTETGDELVANVKIALEFIGFNNVKDVDKEIDENGEKQRQEDLQIGDTSPTLLIEVKGKSGLSVENDILQIDKYVDRRKDEWKTDEVKGVLIINHQKDIPSLERDNNNVFTDIQLKDAKLKKIAVLSTWDLFVLIRGKISLGWDSNELTPLFYVDGRIPLVPSNSKLVGKVVKYYEEPKVVSVEINENELIAGKTIGYLSNNKYYEEKIQSLQVDRQDVNGAFPGQRAGIKTKYPKHVLKKGTIVYQMD